MGATLGLAAGCWLIFLTHADSPALVPMTAVMMAAMMLPSAVPLVAGQAARPAVSIVVVLAVYVVIWTLVGTPAMLLADRLPMAGIAAALAVFAAAIAYGFTPLQRACRRRCIALCRERSPALRLGLEYGLSCVGCSAGVMAALFVLGPMNPLWMLLATGAVVLYKLPLRRGVIA